MKQDVRNEWIAFVSDLRTEWWFFFLGPLVFLLFVVRVWRARHRPA